MHARERFALYICSIPLKRYNDLKIDVDFWVFRVENTLSLSPPLPLVTRHQLMLAINIGRPKLISPHSAVIVTGPKLIYSYVYSFIHSFILNIYIAPLQENYSEALPTPARLKRAVLS